MRSPAIGASSMAVLLVASAAQTTRARADSLDNRLGPRELAVGEAMRGGATGATSVGLNPSALSLNREVVFEGGYGYRPTDSASLISVSACDSTNALPGCFFYDYAGSSLESGDMKLERSSHVAGISLSRMILPRVLIGTTTRYYSFNSSMTGESDASGTTFDAGLVVRLTQLINIGVAMNNFYSTTTSPEFPRAVGGGIYARPISALALSFDARWRLEGDDRAARYGGGAELFLGANNGQSGYPLRVGALHDNNLGSTYLSAGLGYQSMDWGIDIGGRREVKGGDETVIVASMRIFGPRLPPPAVE